MRPNGWLACFAPMKHTKPTHTSVTAAFRMGELWGERGVMADVRTYQRRRTTWIGPRRAPRHGTAISPAPLIQFHLLRSIYVHQENKLPEHEREVIKKEKSYQKLSLTRTYVRTYGENHYQESSRPDLLPCHKRTRPTLRHQSLQVPPHSRNSSLQNDLMAVTTKGIDTPR